MKGLENQIYLTGYIISNIVSLLLLFFSVIFPRVARFLFCLLFAYAGFINWKMSMQSPENYVRASEVALAIYKSFITGWFSRHVLLFVGAIATAQVLIALSLLLKGTIYKIGVVGAIVFLVAITPLGIASAFPSTIVMAYAMIWLLKGQHEYIWRSR